MLTSDFDYQLPVELIATKPSRNRTGSRLLCFEPGISTMDDMKFADLPKMLHPDDVLVINDSKVIPARLQLHKESGGKIELLLERILPDGSALMQLRANRRPKEKTRLNLNGQYLLEVTGYLGEFAKIRAVNADLMQILHQHGQVPLPPYIARAPDSSDWERYQTVYAQHEGSVAAPTAGLHFSKKLLQKCKSAGAQIIPITLHIGAGTFQPVRSEHVEQHTLHQEYFHITAQSRELIRQAKQKGGRIIAVGTSAVRALEADCSNEQNATTLFIHPGYKFKMVDAMLTNFHLPKSSLIMLVCAFAGMRQTMQAYQHAIKNKYRFYSYGDAMFIQKCSSS